MPGRLQQWFDSVFRRRRIEEELDEELRSSVDLLADRFAAKGMPREVALRAARLEFEGVEQVRERVRDGLAGSGARAALHDIRYAWRALWRRPSFAVVALVTLALGIGVNTAVFSVFHAVLLRRLPFANPEQLVFLWLHSGGSARAPVSGPILGEIARRNRSLAGVAGIWVGVETLRGDDPEQVKVAQVTPNFFDVLGVSAANGRTFMKEEEGRGDPALVLTRGLFARRFAGDPRRIGQTVPMRGATSTLVGVLPEAFDLHFPPDTNVPRDVPAFIPFPFDIYEGPPMLYYIRAIARLSSGVTVAQAQSDLDRIAGEIARTHTAFAGTRLRFTVAAMHADSVRDIQPALAALFAGAAFVLLICCVNVTSLVLARASDRQREIALRLALGASRGRIIRQLLSEGIVLCLLGGALGIAAGWAGFRALLAIRPERLAGIGNTVLSWPVLGAAAATALGAALLFGLAPAIESFRLSLTSTLRCAGRGSIGRMHRRAGGALVIGEIALGFVLVTGAVLAARSLTNIERVRPGFEPRNLLTFQISFGETLYPRIPLNSIAEWEADLAAIPGVERVGATSHLPLDDFPNWFMRYRPDGVSERDAAGLIADHRCVTAGYHAALGARLLEGRYFDVQDRADARPVVIVDELLARAAWPGQSAVGKKLESQHVTPRGFAPITAEVVGVVEHVRNHSVRRIVRPQVYIPFEQSPRSPLSFAVRTRVDPLSLVPAIREKLRSRAPELALAKVQPMTGYVARDIAPAAFTAVLAACFGTLSLVLAGTGIYGVLNYQVSRRLPEMGIRMALGAGARDVRRLVLKEGLALASAGAAVGIAASLAAAAWLGSLVYGVSSRDPLSYAAALVLLPAAAVLGCWLPARRAAAANPADTIREE